MEEPPITAPILVVDDAEYNRDLLARRLKRRGFAVETANDGYQALEAMERKRFGLVLLDIMMPGIDGFEVLARIRSTHPATDLPVIMVTAKDQSDDIVRALELGANDYVTKPVDFAVALARINTHLLVARSQAELRIAHGRMKRELETAAITQRRLLPSASVDAARVHFGWEYQPCDELGGDMLNVFHVDEDRLGMYVLDVSGHGVQAALLSFAASRSLSLTAGAGSPERAVGSPGEVARRLNEEYAVTETNGLIFTLVYGELDCASGRFTYVCAGHPDPVLLRADGEVIQLKSAGGPPIGTIEGVDFVPGEVTLQAGERIFLFSDGVYEQPNHDRVRFGWNRLVDTVATLGPLSPTDAARALARAASQWADGLSRQDDMSVLTFSYLP